MRVLTRKTAKQACGSKTEAMQKIKNILKLSGGHNSWKQT